MSNTIKTVLMGALGLCVAAMLGYLSLQLVSQPVGLSSEPLTAGNTLVPPAREVRKVKKKAAKAAPATALTGSDNSSAAPAPAPAPAPVPAAQSPSDGDYVQPHDDGDDHHGGGGHHDD